MQNRTDSGTPRIKVNPTKVLELMEHPVLMYLLTMRALFCSSSVMWEKTSCLLRTFLMRSVFLLSPALENPREMGTPRL